jgi:Flp pilus assembly secretin CpaC
VRAGFSIAYFCALSFVPCAESVIHAQVQSSSPQPVAVSTQDSANDLVVAVGKSVLVDCAQTIQRIAIGSAELAEATAVSPSEVMINGKAAGETTLIVWQVGGARQFFNVKIRASTSVVNDHMESLRRELRTELPGQTLRVTSEGGTIFLRGTVKDIGSSDRAVQIASTAGKVVNLLYVNVPPPEPQILLKVRFASLDRTLTRHQYIQHGRNKHHRLNYHATVFAANGHPGRGRSPRHFYHFQFAEPLYLPAGPESGCYHSGSADRWSAADSSRAQRFDSERQARKLPCRW